MRETAEISVGSSPIEREVPMIARHESRAPSRSPSFAAVLRLPARAPRRFGRVVSRSDACRSPPVQ